ncbi:hypothetical protein C8J56DRAFT_930471 [Mycena floridula]|nr:hypothetical protein C8J56DRAFT_930471 [Mycena floridula]
MFDRQEDPLFLERLDAFMETSIKAFSERERRTLEETRKHVTEWHFKQLSQAQPMEESPLNASERQTQLSSILTQVSRTLESLAICGIQSFVLAVDPIANDTISETFLGGTSLGREFWRTLRNGGETGAKVFLSKAHNCATSFENAPGPSSTKVMPAKTLKTELYERFRQALRIASDSKNAEMKWTNHSKLVELYNVQLIGWPEDIPVANPSTLKVEQNKVLLKLLEAGTLHFVKAFTFDMPTSNTPEPSAPTPLESAIAPLESLSWAIHETDSADVTLDRPRKRIRD